MDIEPRFCLLIAALMVFGAACSSDLDLQQRRFRCSSDRDCVNGYYCGTTAKGHSACLPESEELDATDEVGDARDTGIGDARDTADIDGEDGDTEIDARDAELDAADTSDTSDAGASDADTSDADAADADASDADASDAETCTPETYYRDDDGDGFGDPTATAEACAAPTGFVDRAGDCDDNSATTFPGAASAEMPSACTNDDDGDGYGDASPPPGVTAGTDCDDANSSISPGVTESCNEVDDDCDGAIDEGGCECNYQGSPNGVCADAVTDSSGVCVAPADYQSTGESICDNQDNDCDGTVDENITRSCADANSPCTSGVESCALGSWGSCSTRSIGQNCSDDCECATGSCWTTTGTCTHRIFVSSDTSTGGFATSPDDFCQTLASDAGLSGTWKAIVSTGSSNAYSRITVAGKVVRMDNVKVADDGADLWDGSIDHAINVDENGSTGISDVVWTGTNSDGSSSISACAGWTSSAAGLGFVGSTDATDTYWVKYQTRGCNTSARVYCINGQ